MRGRVRGLGIGGIGIEHPWALDRLLDHLVSYEAANQVETHDLLFSDWTPELGGPQYPACCVLFIEVPANG